MNELPLNNLLSDNICNIIIRRIGIQDHNFYRNCISRHPQNSNSYVAETPMNSYLNIGRRRPKAAGTPLAAGRYKSDRAGFRTYLSADHQPRCARC